MHIAYIHESILDSLQDLAEFGNGTAVGFDPFNLVLGLLLDPLLDFDLKKGLHGGNPGSRRDRVPGTDGQPKRLCTSHFRNHPNSCSHRKYRNDQNFFHDLTLL